MIYPLRPYQEEAVQGLHQAFAKGSKRLILEMPTGAGKTLTFVHMVHRSLQRGKKAMIICDRKELISQAGDKINSLGLMPTIIAPKYHQSLNNIYLASVDTLRRRAIPDVDLVIVDEAHKQSFDNVLKRVTDQCDPFVIGATATPFRSSGQNCLSEIYDDIIHGPKVSELIDLGFLVPATTYAAKEDFSQMKKKGLEFDMGAMFDRFNQPTLYDGVIDNYKKFSPGEKAICFNVNVEHSKIMTEKARAEGITSAHIDGETPDFERRRILEDFHNGEFQMLNNCSVLTTGYDEPSIETVIVNRATTSISLYLQMCGRGSRPHDFKGLSGKEKKGQFKIIDQGANVYRHGLWESDREWSLYKKQKRTDGVAPIKACMECGAINNASARVCKTCSAPFEIAEKTLKQGEFIEVQKKNRRGAGKKPQRPDPRTASFDELDDYASVMGYKDGWVYHQLNSAGRANEA